jgi:hypothetical protein
MFALAARLDIPPIVVAPWLTTGAENGEMEANAQARAVQVWIMWLRHWRDTRDPRALHTARIWRAHVREVAATRRAELKAQQAVYRDRRADLALDEAMYCIRYEELVRGNSVPQLAFEASSCTPLNPKATSGL